MTRRQITASALSLGAVLYQRPAITANLGSGFPWRSLVPAKAIFPRPERPSLFQACRDGFWRLLHQAGFAEAREHEQAGSPAC